MGISRHIEMQDLPPVVADDEKAVQNTKREYWDGSSVADLRKKLMKYIRHYNKVPKTVKRRVGSVDGDASDDVEDGQAEDGDGFLTGVDVDRPTHFLSIRPLGPLWVGSGT